MNLGSRLKRRRFGVWGLGFGASKTRLALNSALGFRVSGVWFQIAGLELRLSYFVFRVSCFVFRISGFAFRISCFRWLQGEPDARSGPADAGKALVEHRCGKKQICREGCSLRHRKARMEPNAQSAWAHLISVCLPRPLYLCLSPSDSVALTLSLFLSVSVSISRSLSLSLPKPSGSGSAIQRK